MKQPNLQPRHRQPYSYEHEVRINWETGEMTLKLTPEALDYAAGNVVLLPPGRLYMSSKELSRVLSEQQRAY